MTKFPSIILSLCLCTILIMACGQNQNNKPATSSSKSISGSSIFKNKCTLCHGIDGTLQLNGARDLTKSTLTLDERITVITKGRNTMTGFESLLSTEEIKAVAEYTLTFKD